MTEIRSLCLDIVGPPQTTQITSIPEAHRAGFGGRSLKLRQRLRWQKLAVKCCGDGDALQVKPEDEMNREDNCVILKEEDSVSNSKKDDVNEKVELMEKEAIMGKDDGREPIDYKRRAGIFYKSSEVFQANRDQPHHCT
ncbi:hypothetical protein R6Q57_027292 [Mikania cordata]